MDSLAEGREKLPWVAFLLVIAALVALALTPVLILQRLSRTTEQISMTVLPAYVALRDLAFAMEERVSASRSRYLTGEPRYDVQLDEARAAEMAALRSVAAVAPRLGAAAVGHTRALQAYIGRRDSLEAELRATGEELEAFRIALPRFDALRDSMLVQLASLQQELTQVAQSRIAEETRWAQRQRTLSALLGVVALLAAVIVGWFAWWQRRLRWELQRALAEANRQRAVAEQRGEELQRAAESRARLLRGITHDVKNPLGAARGYAELLEMGIKAPLLPEQEPFVAGIVRSIDGALAIIADLLDLARADSGALTVSRVEVDLARVVRAAANDHRPAAEAAGHTLEVRGPAAPLLVYTDPARVQQVLANLVSNAIKYTPPPGRITISWAQDGEGGTRRAGEWVALRVIDTGPGIPPEQREAIFDEFTRLEEGSALKGHGLGLPMARRIARLLGGDLTVEERAGGGATFVLWLPVRQEDQSAPSRGTERDPVRVG